MHFVIMLAYTAFQSFLKLPVDKQGSAFRVSLDTYFRPLSGRQTLRMEHELIAVTTESKLSGILPVGYKLRMRAFEQYRINIRC